MNHFLLSKICVFVVICTLFLTISGCAKTEKNSGFSMDKIKNAKSYSAKIIIQNLSSKEFALLLKRDKLVGFDLEIIEPSEMKGLKVNFTNDKVTLDYFGLISTGLVNLPNQSQLNTAVKAFELLESEPWSFETNTSEMKGAVDALPGVNVYVDKATQAVTKIEMSALPNLKIAISDFTYLY